MNFKVSIEFSHLTLSLAAWRSGRGADPQSIFCQAVFQFVVYVFFFVSFRFFVFVFNNIFILGLFPCTLTFGPLQPREVFGDKRNSSNVYTV